MKRRVRRFSDKRSGGGKAEDVLGPESGQKKYKESEGGKKECDRKRDNS